jgi:hypothetical protein
MKRWRLDVSNSLGVCLEGLKKNIVTFERMICCLYDGVIINKNTVRIWIELN